MSREMQIALDSIWPILKAGLIVTIPLSLIAFAIALVVAVITALARISNFKILRGIFGIYVWIFVARQYLCNYSSCSSGFQKQV